MFLMTSVRDLMTQEGAAVACAKRKDALCFIRFMSFSASIEHLRRDAKRRRKMSESLALASTFGHPSEQADASKH